MTERGPQSSGLIDRVMFGQRLGLVILEVFPSHNEWFYEWLCEGRVYAWGTTGWQILLLSYFHSICCYSFTAWGPGGNLIISTSKQDSSTFKTCAPEGWSIPDATLVISYIKYLFSGMPRRSMCHYQATAGSSLLSNLISPPPHQLNL